jgi:hypothetical protein
MHAAAIAERQGRSAADRLAAAGALPFRDRLAMQPMPPALQLAPSKPFRFCSRTGSAPFASNGTDNKLAAPPRRGESGKDFALGVTQQLHQLTRNRLRAGADNKTVAVGGFDFSANFG